MKSLETTGQLTQLIEDGPVMTVFSAEWCPDCRIIEPVLPEIEKEHPNFTFVMIDRDQFIDLCQEYNVFGIPSFIAFKNGKEIGRFVSKDRKTKEEVKEFINGLPN